MAHGIRYILGLAILVAILMVASVPALLEPTTDGVEQLATRVGLLKEPKATTSGADADGEAVTDPADAQLAMRGYLVEDDGDLRDTLDPADREAMEARGRLRAGSDRLLLPGQAARDSNRVPPAQSEDGVLLDVTGCPMFRPDADVAALVADPDTQARYAEKVQDADDPAACAPLLQQRITAATAAPTTQGSYDRATDRQRRALRRGSAAAMLIGLSELSLMEQLLDREGLEEALAALDGEPATTAGTGAAAESGAAGERRTTAAGN